MPGRRGLKDGLPRMLGRHDGWAGRRYRAVFLDLQAELGPFGALARLEAARVAALRVQLEVATAALVDAQRSRRDGKGRRPSVQAVERAARRAGLADGSYSAALDKLQELAAQHRKPASIAELAARQRAGA